MFRRNTQPKKPVKPIVPQQQSGVPQVARPVPQPRLPAVVPAKFYFMPGTDVRRVTVPRNVSFNIMRDFMAGCYAKQFQQKLRDIHYIQMSYKDEDGEWIRVDDTEEWSECLKIPNIKSFKIRVVCREGHLEADIWKEWTSEEELIAMDAHEDLGDNWQAISTLLEGRSDSDVKDHWNTVLAKKSKENPVRKQAPQVQSHIPPQQHHAYRPPYGKVPESNIQMHQNPPPMTSSYHQPPPQNRPPQNQLRQNPQQFNRGPQVPPTRPNIRYPNPQMTQSYNPNYQRPVHGPPMMFPGQQPRQQHNAPPQQPQSQLARNYGDMEIKLKKLHDMGFKDRVRNTKILGKYNGDVQASVQALVRGETM